MEGGTEKDGVWRKQSQEIREGQATADAYAQTSVMTYVGGGGGGSGKKSEGSTARSDPGDRGGRGPPPQQPKR